MEDKYNLKEQLRLYLVTDRHWLKEKNLEEDVLKAIEGGVTLVQIREKEMDEATFIDSALCIKKICKIKGVPFIVNDNLNVAIAVNADGLHIGQKDGNVAEIRRKLCNHKILGVSATTVESAVAAEIGGADYLGVGAVFKTGSKNDAIDVSWDTLKAICKAVNIPVIAIGGITERNVALLAGSGIHGIAVISAILAQADIKAAAKDLKSKLKEVIR